jgi:hypothetical protein
MTDEHKQNKSTIVLDNELEKSADRAKSFIQARFVSDTAKVSVTDSAQTVVLTTQDEAAAELLNAGEVGDPTIYFCEEGETPDTDSYELRTGERIFLNGSIEVVCDSGKSATLKILKVK